MVIGGFTFFVYAWSIRAVKQDDFTDVEVPSATEKANTRSIEEELAEAARRKKELVDGFASPAGLEKASPVVAATKDAFKKV